MPDIYISDAKSLNFKSITNGNQTLLLNIVHNLYSWTRDESFFCLVNNILNLNFFQFQPLYAEMKVQNATYSYYFGVIIVGLMYSLQRK